MKRAVAVLIFLRSVWSGSIILVASVTAATFLGVLVDYRLAPTKMTLEQGHAYLIPLQLPWPLTVVSDDTQAKKASGTKILEDGQPLGPPHTVHNRIRTLGHGCFSHWQGKLFFSTSDNSDPRSNGRKYVAVIRVRLVPQLLLWLLLGFVGAFAGVAVWWHRSGLIGLRDLTLPATLWAGFGLVSLAASQVEGISLWLLLGLGAVLLIWAIATMHRTYLKGTGRPRKAFGRAQNLTLAVLSLCVGLTGAEALLLARERRAVGPETSALPLARAPSGPVEPVATSKAAQPESGSEAVETEPLRKPAEPAASTEPVDPLAPIRETDARRPAEARSQRMPIERALESFGVTLPPSVVQMAARRQELVTLPPKFAREPLKVAGAARAYRWHGVLHVYNRRGMRWTTPFPRKQEDVFRIMVVGDSLTYGEGIDERWTYSRQLQALLEPDYAVEVLNLGIDGSQSEDVLWVVIEYLPHLRPDLVVYGVCLNDFLPSGVGQYQNNHAYKFPLPNAVKAFFTRKSRLARLVDDTYDRVLLRLDLRVDFYDDILNGFTGYQSRFAQDVARLNEVVKAQGLPAVVALVLDQFPGLDSRGHRIAQAAESHLRSAGMEVIDTAPYYRRFDRLSFAVSRWEGHPNEVANAIWAVMLDRHLRSLRRLRAFRKSED